MEKTRYIDVSISSGIMSGIFKRLSWAQKGADEEKLDFSDIAVLRHLLSNQRVRILHTIKAKNPESIYRLARILERDFKSVNNDVKFLEKFGFIDFVAEKHGKRERYKPTLAISKMNIVVSI